MTEFYCPTKIWTGKHALDMLQTLHAKRVFLVTDPYFVSSGKTAEIERRLAGAEIQIFDQVQPDPPAELAAKGAAACKLFPPDLLIALGGGSAMDCAKGIRLAMEKPVTFLAIPTTSGSGSEVTSFSILSKGDVKHVLIDPLLRPDIAILDDSLLHALPQALIADTGMDLLAHCVEALAATGGNEITQALAMHAGTLVLQHLQSSYEGDRAVRGRIHEAATMAGMAFDNAGLGLCHAAAHALGGVTHLPHGRLCAMILPFVMQYNQPAVLPKYARLAAMCGLSGATEKLSLRNLIGYLERLRKAMGLPSTLHEAGIRQLDFTGIINTVKQDPCCQTNPVPVTEEAILKLLKEIAG